MRLILVQRKIEGLKPAVLIGAWGESGHVGGLCDLASADNPVNVVRHAAAAMVYRRCQVGGGVSRPVVCQVHLHFAHAPLSLITASTQKKMLPQVPPPPIHSLSRSSSRTEQLEPCQYHNRSVAPTKLKRDQSRPAAYSVSPLIVHSVPPLARTATLAYPMPRRHPSQQAASLSDSATAPWAPLSLLLLLPPRNRKHPGVIQCREHRCKIT